MLQNTLEKNIWLVMFYTSNKEESITQEKSDDSNLDAIFVHDDLV